MKTATTFHSDFFNTDCLILEDNTIVFSITGASQVINGGAGGSAVQGIRKAIAKIGVVQSPVVATDPSDLPEILTVLVPRPNGSVVEAQAITQETFIKVLKQYKGRKSIGGKNAERMLDSLLGVSIDLILKKEAGLVSEETTKEIDASIAQFFKAVPGNEKADPINEIKEMLIANGQKDRCKRMGVLINEIFYNRLPTDVYDEMLQRVGGWRRSTFKTNWQQLSTPTQKRIEDIVVIARVFIEDEMAEGPIFNWAPIIQKLDRVMPRHRSSGYAAL